MNSRVAYDAAFKMIRSQRNMENKLDEIGFNFEYGSGIVGTHFEVVLNNCEAILKEAMGLHSVGKDGTCNICGTQYPVTIDILYTEDENADFSITEDDFCEFCYNAVNDAKIGDELIGLMWKAIVEKDAEAKEKYNSLAGRVVIGYMK